MTRFYDSITDMEPLLPADRDGSLAALGWQIVRRAERLGAALHPITARGLAGVVQVMNSYYSHQIEGHHTTPADLDAVMSRALRGTPERRHLQQLHLAHLQAQSSMEQQLCSGLRLGITDPEFIAGLHARFYEALPEETRYVPGQDERLHAVRPGAWRDFNVSVGRHLAPSHGALPLFLKRFTQVYAPQVRDTGTSLVVCAAAHHRLVWIHPFADGNGRVARLFSQAWLHESGAHAHGLWSVSRGIARRLEDYRSALAAADEKRRHDTDGRGYLSEEALSSYCRFFLETCMDQLDYMTSCLAVDTLLRRITGYAELRQATGDLPRQCALLLREVCLRGEIPRGDAARVIGKSPRTAQAVVQSLLTTGHLTSPSEKGLLHLGFPTEALGVWFPGLFGSSFTA
jgi:Fic family protein